MKGDKITDWANYKPLTTIISKFSQNIPQPEPEQLQPNLYIQNPSALYLYDKQSFGKIKKMVKE